QGLLNSTLHHLTKKSNPIQTIGLFYYRLRNGGIERVISLLTERWVSQGYQIVLFTDESPSPEDFPLPARVKRVVLPAIDPNNYTNQNGYEKRYRVLIDQLNKNHVDLFIYHAWLSPALLWDMISIKQESIPFIIQTHGFFATQFVNNNPNIYDMSIIYQLADCVITLSADDKYYWSTYVSKAVHIPNPSTFDLTITAEKKKSLHNKNILWLARISTQKDIYSALEILSLVLQQEPEAKLLVVGDTPDQSEWLRVQKRVDELALSDSIIFYGFHKDVERFYDMASIFLMTSLFEGAPMTLREAQYYHLPVVMFDLPYLDSVKNGKGIQIVPPGDFHAAAQELVSLLQSQDYRNVQGDLSWQNLCEESSFDIDKAWADVFSYFTLSSPNEVLPEMKNTMEKKLFTMMLSQYHRGIHCSSPSQLYVDEHLSYTNQAIADAKHSFSFRVGQVTLAFPKKIKSTLRKIKSK
ncbi:MAG: glycosyltransferase family 4 protein, partial [Clostridiales bacterium]|nr:glycosyltransferase family 4 protein [Clostridiales bacterium]